MTFTVRPARAADAATIYRLVRELAAFEDALDSVLASEATLERALFGPDPAAEALIVETADPASEATALGYAVFYSSFSTWTGQRGLWLDDLYVRPEARGSGAGAALLKTLAGIAVDRECARFEWWVLDWNVAAAGFYRARGAVPQTDRTVHRLTGDALLRLAGRL